MGRILIVSNRLPVTVRVEKRSVSTVPSAGGLASGLRTLHEQPGTLWIGWPGDSSKLEPEQRHRLDRELEEHRMRAIHLTASEIRQYYDGFSNGVLWPIFLYLTDQIQREAWSHWTTYVEVNQKFADAIETVYRPGDIIWVHDYHLALVPQMLRERIPQARIGFFLHIPFPSSEVFRILPWRRQILEGLLGADLIGFHTSSYVRHFNHSLLQLLGIPVTDNRFVRDQREVRVGAHPMGIHCETFEQIATDDSVLRIEMPAHHSLLLGVDRLDHAKGIPRRVLAVDRLLEQCPSLGGQMRFLQIVVPSRTHMDSYRNFRSDLDQLVGRVNSTRGSVESLPIHYLYRNVPLPQLVALYRATTVMLVTPLRDGMNLVAKEFIASRVDDDGVLILSEFAGASAELSEALVVNPYDIDAMARTIRRALEMPKEERQSRMRALRDRVRLNSASHWVDSFLQSLEGVARQGPPSSGGSLSSRDELDRLVARASEASELRLVLDYDGTLVSFRPSPDQATPDPELLALLDLLAHQGGTEVHIVSGRSSDDLERWFGGCLLHLHAEHGATSRKAGATTWEHSGSRSLPWRSPVRQVLEEFTRCTPGAMWEEKALGFAWHYRVVEEELGEFRAQALTEQLGRLLEGTTARIFWSSKTVDIASREFHKGHIVQAIRRQAPSGCLMIAVGDDRTDEDMFAAQDDTGISVHVGTSPSRASLRIADTACVRQLLRRIAERRRSATPRLVGCS